MNPSAELSDSNRLRVMRAVYACRKKIDGLDEDAAWRKFLANAAGKSSLRAMDGRELGRVLDALHRAGAPRLAPRRADGATADLMRKVRALWLSLHALGEVRDASDGAIGGFVHRQTGVDAVQWLEPSQFAQVIEALRGWCARAGYRAPEGAAAKECNELLIRAQWEKLIALGAMRTGVHARLETWIRKNYTVAHESFLTPPQQLDAIGKLGRWIWREKEKARP